MTTYVTVFPYCYKLHSHSVRYTLCAASEWGLHTPSRQTQTPSQASSGPCQLNLTQAAGGWHSCAEGVPTGQSAASVSSVPSSEWHRKDKKSFHLYLCRHPRPVLLNTLHIHQFILSHHFTETMLKLCMRCSTETDAFEILSASSSTLFCVLTEAAQYKRLILKPRRKKFQRSSKAPES